MPSIKSYGAVGDGVTDDTAAIQRALADGRSSPATNYSGVPKALYFPAGTYLVHDTLQWIGCCVTLQGAGPSASIIRLAPGSSGFGDSSNPKPLIITPLGISSAYGNTSFRQNIWDLGLSIGANNPGATALNYVSNNRGSVHNVLATSEDGQGHAGIDLTRKWAGPLLIRNTEVHGFDVGIDLQNAEYSSTFEDITVEDQNLVGIRNSNQPIAIRNLISNNSVPGLTNTGGAVVLIGGAFRGGNSAYTALSTNNSMYLRGVTASGYKATLLDTSTGTPVQTKGSITELVVGQPVTLTGSQAAGSLKLNIEETPSYISSRLTDWAPFVPRWSGDASTLQATLNSGSHTIYFPFGAYGVWHPTTVTVPDTVNRIVGFSSVINSGAAGGGIRFVVSGNSTTPLIIEQFGYGLQIDHTGSRPLVIKDAQVNDYETAAGAGNLFLEDVQMPAFTVQNGQQVWARQLDDEVAGTKITNLGGSLWILGLKTELAGTVIDTENGGQTELLGALIYPAKVVPTTDVAFKSVDSKVSYMYRESVYCAGCGYSIQVSQTTSGQTTTVNSKVAPFRMPLFVGYN